MANPYSSVTVSGYDDANVPNDGSRTSANRVDYDALKADLTDPLKTALESINANVQAAISVIDARIQTPNVLVNGDFRVAQEGAGPFTSTTTASGGPANTDDTYLLDQWILLSNGNDIVDVSQETTRVPAGAWASMKLEVETADTKFAIFQPVEGREARKILDGKSSLSFKASKDGTTIGSMMAMVIGWDGTEDTITSDVISAWNTDGSQPSLVTNWTAINTPQSLTVGTATTFQTFTIENIGTSTQAFVNVGVLLVSNTTSATVSDVLYIGDVVLQPGAVTQTLWRRSVQEETARAQRFYSTLDVSTTNGDVWVGFPVEMRTTPTITATAGTATNETVNGVRVNHTTTATTTLRADARL